MRNLNELRCADLASVSSGELEDARVDMSKEEEIGASKKEAEVLDSILKELDEFYEITEYVRMGCLSHKVGEY